MKHLLLALIFLLVSDVIYGQAYGEFEGEIQSSTLIGTDDRNVVAQPDGTLKIGPDKSLKYLTIPASAFHPTFDDGTPYFSTTTEAVFVGTSANSVGFIAPILLPHDSQIITITYYYWDISSTQDCVFKLNEYNVNTNTINVGFAPNTTSSGSGGNGVINVSPISSFINNINNSYSVTIEPASPSNSLDDVFSIRSVKITYK